jgi:hypothetical protein
MRFNWRPGSTVIIANGLRHGPSGIRIPTGMRDFSLPKIIKTGFGSKQAPAQVATGVLLPEGGGVKLTTHQGSRAAKRLNQLTNELH